eukprot:1136784-Pelagomonas_calceolata.AAC.2
MHARASARCTFGCNSGVCHLFAQLTFARRLNWMHLWTPAAAHAFMHAISPGLIYHLKLTTSMLAQSHQTSSGSDRIHSQGTSGSGEESILSLCMCVCVCVCVRVSTRTLVIASVQLWVQPVQLDFKHLSWCSARTKHTCARTKDHTRTKHLSWCSARTKHLSWCSARTEHTCARNKLTSAFAHRARQHTSPWALQHLLFVCFASVFGQQTPWLACAACLLALLQHAAPLCMPPLPSCRFLYVQPHSLSLILPASLAASAHNPCVCVSFVFAQPWSELAMGPLQICGTAANSSTASQL